MSTRWSPCGRSRVEPTGFTRSVLGAQLVLAAGDSTFWWNTGGPVLSRFHRTGRLLERVRRTDLPRTAVTKERLDQAIDARAVAMEANLDEAAFNRVRERLKSSAIPDSLPVYGEMWVDRPGNLWVERIPSHPDPDAPVEWNVFEAEGRFLGTVQLPPGLELFEIGEDYVVGLRRDELGLEYMLWLPLVKPAEES